jgi:hypothetical protein
MSGEKRKGEYRAKEIYSEKKNTDQQRAKQALERQRTKRGEKKFPGSNAKRFLS